MDKTKQYLDKAAECLAIAETAPPEARAALIAIAEQYTRLAEYAAKERDARRPEPPDFIIDEDSDGDA